MAHLKQPGIPLSGETKTLRYLQDNIHDFAWFADKNFQVDHDTLQLPSGRVIDVYSFYKPSSAFVWKNSIRYIKDAVRFRSVLIGEYPFNVVTAAEIRMGSTGGMEYPTITGITHYSSGKALDMTIEHEVGHNWFYAILGTNERSFPWMDEGINTYYDNRYEALKYPSPSREMIQAAPGSPNQELLLINTLAKERKDQPISTSSEDFTKENYSLIAYAKTGLWMKQLEDSLGAPLFDSCMRQYFFDWQFKHPYPEDFRAVMERTSRRDLEKNFALLDEKGPLTPFLPRRMVRPAFLFSTRNTDKISYINVAPVIGYNKYDQFMAGVIIHNFDLPPNALQFIVAPLYATGSHQWNGIGRVSYSWYPPDGARYQKFEIGLSGSRFSTLTGIDSNGHTLFGGFYKIVPSARLIFKNPNPLSARLQWIEWKTYLIGERPLSHFVLKTSDSIYYPTPGPYAFRYLNQLSYNLEDNRVLYPYKASVQFQQASDFYRINVVANYFFNYETGGGLDLRFFGAKFGYIGTRNSALDLSIYEPKLTAVRGNEDYTYSNYFFGRTEFTGFASQQIMMRDGNLKLRTDLFQDLQGRSDNWVASMNLSTTLPASIVPLWLPLKIFLDVGTYAQAWQDNPPTSHFLYVGGLELCLVHNLINIYVPLFYSGDFSASLKTVPDQNGFFKKISFSINIQDFNFHKFFNTPF
jgi:hypothetical protein